MGFRFRHGFRERGLITDPLENPLQRSEQQRLIVNEKYETRLFRRGIAMVVGRFRAQGCHDGLIGLKIGTLEWIARAL